MTNLTMQSGGSHPPADGLIYWCRAAVLRSAMSDDNSAAAQFRELVLQPLGDSQMYTVEPSPERFSEFRSGAETEGPVVMINLLRFREQADYAAESGEEPCSGREAYRRYGALAFPMVEAVQGRVLFRGPVQCSVIAPADEEWDEAILVEYPSRAAMLQMLGDEAYQAIVHHRRAALLDSRLIATAGGRHDSSG